VYSINCHSNLITNTLILHLLGDLGGGNGFHALGSMAAVGSPVFGRGFSVGGKKQAFWTEAEF
jgi:hypothetical protein